jgi:hypothetical protein
MTALYELSSEYSFLRRDLIDEETGEVNESILDQLSTISESIEKKGINLVRVMKDMQAEQEAVEKERKRLQDRERIITKQIERLKEYLLSNMERCEIQKISCPQFVISVRKNPESVEILDESQIDSKYHRIKVEINKSDIKNDLKIGAMIPGARLVRTSSLSIK